MNIQLNLENKTMQNISPQICLITLDYKEQMTVIYTYMPKAE